MSSLLRVIHDPDITAPSTPAILSVTAVGQNRLDIVWTQAIDTGGAGLAGYDLLADGSRLIELGVQLSYSDTGLNASSTHNYRVRARDAATPVANLGAYSSLASGQVAEAPPVPGIYNPDYPRFGAYPLGGTQNPTNAALAELHVAVVIHYPGWEASKGTTWAAKCPAVRSLSTISTKIVPYTIYTDIQDQYSAAGTSENDVWRFINDNGYWVYQNGLTKTNRIPSYQANWSKPNFTIAAETLDPDDEDSGNFATWKIDRDYRLNVLGGSFNDGTNIRTSSPNPGGFDGVFFDNAFSREQPAANGATGDYNRDGTQDVLSSAQSINLIQTSHAANVEYYRSLHPGALVLGNSNIWPIYHPGGVTGLPIDQVFDGGVLEYIEEWAGYGNVIRGTTFASLLNAIRVQMNGYRPPKLGILSVFITSATNYQQLRYWHGIAALTDTFYYPHLTTGLLAQELGTLVYDEKSISLGAAIDGTQYTPRYQAGANGTGIYVRRFVRGEVWVWAQGGTYTAQSTPVDLWRVTGTTNAANTGAKIAAGATIAGTAGDCAVLLYAAQDQVVPSAPTGLSAVPASSTQINLSWNVSTDTGGSTLAGYRLERSTSATTGFAQIVQQTGATYSDTGRTPGTTYYYRARAYDRAENNSAYSNTASATTTGSTGLLFDDDFASGGKGKTQNGVRWHNNGVNATVVADPTSPSGFALRLRTTIWDAAEECWCEQRFYLGPEGANGTYKDLTFYYKMRVPSNLVHPNGPLFASAPPATNSDNNKWLRVWSRGSTFPSGDGYSPYYYKGGFSTVPLATWGSGCRLISEFGSDVNGEGVGPQDTPTVSPWIEPSDLGTVMEFAMRVKADTLGAPGSQMELTGGNGALQAWRKPQGGSWQQIANQTTLLWRSEAGTHDFFEYGYVTGYLNQGWSESYDWMLQRFSIATGPTGPAQFGIT
jgi:hypothetical protein